MALVIVVLVQMNRLVVLVLFQVILLLMLLDLYQILEDM